MPKNQLPISVVIATLGGDVLKSTIANLNQGEAFPAEILICIPEHYKFKADCVSTIKNLQVIITSCFGQVSQRAVGLSMASQPFVLQLDDDVILPPDTLNVLYHTLLIKGPGNIVAPFFRLQPDGSDGTIYVRGLRGLLLDCYFSVICGAKFGRQRMGTICSAGIGFGTVMSIDNVTTVQSEWLPGGVALCHKNDLITCDYYPFPGKAFSEDLIHSILWQNNGCHLWTVLRVSALIDVAYETFDFKSIFARYRAHAYVAKLSYGSVWLTRLWLIFYFIKHFNKIFCQNSLKNFTHV